MSSTKENLRVTPSYRNTSEKFLLSPSDYQLDLFHRQYYVVYRTRLDFLKNRLMDNAYKLIGNLTFIHFYKLFQMTILRRPIWTS
jgi:hypothetical protein